MGDNTKVSNSGRDNLPSKRQKTDERAGVPNAGYITTTLKKHLNAPTKVSAAQHGNGKAYEGKTDAKHHKVVA